MIRVGGAPEFRDGPAMSVVSALNPHAADGVGLDASQGRRRQGKLDDFVNQIRSLPFDDPRADASGAIWPQPDHVPVELARSPIALAAQVD